MTMGDTESGRFEPHGPGQEGVRGDDDRSDLEDEDELRVQRVEEELRVGTREREAGAIRVRKRVRTEREQLRVPKRREEVNVERVPVEGREAPEAGIGEDEVVMPLTEEEVVVDKRPEVKEEIRVRKDVVQDEEVVEEDFRREEVDVEDQTTEGGGDRLGRGTELGDEDASMPKRVEGAIEIEAPVETVYVYWETLENLPQFMTNVEEVTPTGPDTTHWRAKGPFGRTIEWDAQTTQKEQNSAIAWNSIEGEVGTSGQVRFQEVGSNKTRVEVQMNYSDPPGGKVGEVASRAVANPKLQLEQDLRHLKEILEGSATPEEIQQRPAATTVQSGVVAFLTSGTGLLLLGAGVILLFVLRHQSGRRAEPKGKRRIVFEF